ncbi:MAG: helix-turn-helix domain-containing protein [Ardenticatenaceae bacterium]|nr:helix-turn-helix domain-containing protein [Ardenticatenaceae bacterium]
MVEDWITTAEAAAISGYHPVYLRELIRDGKIRGRKWGAAWQVSRESLLAYLHEATSAEDKRRGPK